MRELMDLYEATAEIVRKENGKEGEDDGRVGRPSAPT